MRPRVLIAAPFPPPATGQSLVTAMAAEALAAEADVLRLDTADRAHVWRRPRAVPSRRVARWAALIADLRRRLRTDAVDVVYLTPASSTLGFLRDVLMVAAVPSRVPIVAHVHVGDYGRLLRRGLGGALARALVRRFARVLTPSAYAAAGIAAACRDADVEVVPNTVRPGLRFTSAEVDAAWAGRRAGRPVVLFLSNMIPSKGYDRLAEAAGHLRHDVDLVFAGAWEDDAARGAFEIDLRARGLHATVLGAVGTERTRDLLTGASVLAFPSTYPHESLPLAVLEAKAAGCAVVAIDHAGVGEMVRDGVDGRLVAGTDSRAFARALDATLDDAERLGRAGATHVREAFAPAAFDAALARAVLTVSSALDPTPA